MHRLVILVFAALLIVPLAITLYAGLRPGAPRVDTGLPPSEAPVQAVSVRLGETLPPRDEATDDPALAAFRDRLAAAARRRDLTAVLASAAATIDLGGDAGAGAGEGLRALLTDPEMAERAWQALDGALTPGGVFIAPDAFCTPTVACIELDCGGQSCDPATTFVATGAATPVHEAPRRDAAVMARLDHKVVAAVDATVGPGPDWVAIAVEDSVGYVARADLRAAAGPLVRLERRGGAWTMTRFITGD